MTPLFPGAAAITAICQPPSCNPSPFNQIGLFGNGKPMTSNPVTVTRREPTARELYIGSTQSQYLCRWTLRRSVVGAPVRLPYVPNSMVISNDGAVDLYGQFVELMTFSALIEQR